MRGPTPDRRALLDERLRAAAERRPRIEIPRLERRGDLPLSFSQERLWFLHQLAPGAADYNVSRALALDGRLEVAALRRSLAGLIERHEALRTSFASGADGPRQEVAASAEARLPVIDLRALPPARRHRLARRLTETEARRPFDLRRGSLARFRLFRLRPGGHLLQATFHHIVVDGWSMSVLFRDLEQLYRAACARRPPDLPALPIRFADFAAWQRRRLRGDELDRQLGYWREALRGVERGGQLLLGDRPAAAERSHRGHRRRRRLAALGSAVHRLGRGEEATPFVVLLAAYQVLLGRYGGSDDVVVGFPVAGRDRRELEGVVGFFVNTLPLRNRLDGDPTFRELLGRARTVVLSALDHRETPLEALVETIDPQRSATRNPLFQALFVYQSAPPPRPSLTGLTARLEPVDTGAAMVDLTLSVEQDGDHLVAELQADADLFDATTATRLLRAYETLLAGIVADPDARLSRLPLLTAAERHLVRVEWTAGAGGHDRELSIPDLFAARVAARPDAVAVTCGDADLSYRELDRRSDRAADRLRALGVRAGDRVGIAVERRLELPVALLAVLKAGAAYVPVEDGAPPARRRQVLDQSAVRWLVAGDPAAGAAGDGAAGDAATVLALDRVLAQATPGTGSPVRRAVPGGDALAYVMHTSGSTGRPKGVAVPHRAVVRLVQRPTFLELGAEDSFLQLAPVAFDASTLEIWAPLLNGGRLVLAPPGPVSLDELAATIDRHGITCLWLTAGLFHQMAEHRPAGLARLRRLLAGGDVLSPAHVQRVLEDLRGRLINGYGPTENTTFTCCHHVPRDSPAGRPVPIGRPIGGTRCHVLDRRLRPLPPGAVGELFAAGDGLAWGYAGRGGLTAERFLPDPFGAPGSRLYRTGDLVRWSATGAVEFLGRRDHQVKIRGFRVELGEVETVLAAHPRVESCAVVVRGEGAERGLAAFVAGDRPPAAELCAYLEHRLPGYMVPSAWTVLDRLPLNASGKVDRRRLEELAERDAPADGGAPRPGERTLPSTDTERTVAAIWEEVLGVDGVGTDESFFRLGGQSLLATKVVSRIRERLDVALPLRRLFDAPTVSGLARAIDELRVPAAAAAGSDPGPPPEPPPAAMPAIPRRTSRPASPRRPDGAFELPDHLRELLET